MYLTSLAYLAFSNYFYFFVESRLKHTYIKKKKKEIFKCYKKKINKKLNEKVGKK